MLYNESTGKPKVQADVFSLESLIAWLETMPADEGYDFYCMGECLLGRWTKSIDPNAAPADRPAAEEIYVYSILGSRRDLSGFEEIAQGLLGARAEWTFGAALARARAQGE